MQLLVRVLDMGATVQSVVQLAWMPGGKSIVSLGDDGEAVIANVVGSCKVILELSARNRALLCVATDRSADARNSSACPPSTPPAIQLHAANRVNLPSPQCSCAVTGDRTRSDLARLPLVRAPRLHVATTFVRFLARRQARFAAAGVSDGTLRLYVPVVSVCRVL